MDLHNSTDVQHNNHSLGVFMDDNSFTYNARYSAK